MSMLITYIMHDYTFSSTLGVPIYEWSKININYHTNTHILYKELYKSVAQIWVCMIYTQCIRHVESHAIRTFLVTINKANFGL